MSGFTAVNYADGQVLFEPGDVAKSFYVIQSGQVAIIDRKRNHQIALLSAGASFGEQALLAGGVRSAAAQAIGATTCMEITAQGLRDLLAKEGGIATPVLEALLLQLYMHNAMKA
ncbi:MAG: cyclic nucleotide-binding domain-containing protein [Betaproteobacteria bacterium]|nr:cyclic nucleotide-binding domain-containing protein [Betaproteobacteria bacterium]